MLRGPLIAGLAAAGILVASCATVSGLDEKEAVDCPGGCAEGGTAAPTGADGSTGRTDGSVPDPGPPACDPTKDVECMPLPAGWSLVALAPIAGGQPPACPSEMAEPSTVEESPSAPATTCTCDGCTVTAPATCSGQVQHAWGSGAGSQCDDGTSPNFYKNTVAGTCYTDLETGFWIAERNRFTLPMPSGGSCSASATKHLDRVTYGGQSLLCDDVSRCSGGVCDARIAAPFAVCVARAGDEACPPGFAEKHVLGSEGAEVDCAACACNMNRAPCQGVVNHYADAACMNLLVQLSANGFCGGPDTEGMRPDSYKVVATSTTTCTVTANTVAATNARMKNARTVCCRS
jgi:hypothetical protein